MKKKKVNALVKLILTTPFLFVLIIGNTSCGGDNGDDIENCDCTTTLHITGEDCCEGANCNCETVAGTRVEGIAVTNRDNVAGFATAIISQIEEAISWLTPDELAIIKSGVKEIRVLPGTGGASTIGGNVITIKENTIAADIYNEFYAIIEVTKKFDLAEEVHMAFFANLL